MSARVFVMVTLALTAEVGAQTPRDQPATRESSGAAAISGRVVAAGADARPIGGAIVTVQSSALAHDLSVVTDDAGRFRVASLPAGRFTVTASKTAFLPGASGASRPGRAGTPIAIAAGQALNDVVVRLTRGAALAGVIRDRENQPAAGVRVTVLKADGTPAGAETTTDDRGHYRVYGLPAGGYVVAATVRPTSAGEMAARSAAEIDAIFAALQTRAGRAASGAAASGAGAGAIESSAPKTMTFAPVFYPGTALFTQAARVTTAPAEDHDDLDFALALTPVASVNGSISTAGGEPAAAVQVTASLLGPSIAPMMPGAASAPRIDASGGAFHIDGLAPGEYTITAQAAGGAEGSLWAIAEVSVNGADVAGVPLVLRRGATFAGRVSFDAAASTAPPDAKGLQVSLADTANQSSAPSGPRAVAAAPANPPPAPGLVRADGTFTLVGVKPSIYRVAIPWPAGANAGWWLRSVLVRGRDALDDSVDVTSGEDVTDAVVVFTNRHSEASGTLQTASGQAATQYFVVAMPTDRALWRPGARRIQSTRPASDGHYAFTDLPEGNYVIVALTDVEPADLADASFLASIAGAGVVVHVTDGARTEQNLRIR